MVRLPDLFQGFHLSNLGSRLVAGLAGAGLALTAAVAVATYLKVFGIGLLGNGERAGRSVPWANSLAVGMPIWLQALAPAAANELASAAVPRMHVGPLPATGAPIRVPGTFAFISPTLLVVVMPLLALFPVMMLLWSRRFPVRRTAVWFGGREQAPRAAATTALTFSNALRIFYSFVYRPTIATQRELAQAPSNRRYFVRRLVFSHDVAPIFGPYLFAPLERAVSMLAGKLQLLQSGQLNFYLALIGALLIIILMIALV